MPLGLQYSAMVYNTFGMSVLTYVSQLERPPEWIWEKEKAALRTAAKGPGFWAIPNDLWRLKEHFGLSRSFRSLQCMSQAAMLRV